MSNRLSHLLTEWQSAPDDDWVLGSVYKTEGSAYRKAGAFMLISAKGGRFGLLSGGCLESDIQRHARKVMETGRALTLTYDSTDEDDMTFQLGLGCGGIVHILLQPVTAANDLGLHDLADALDARSTGTFWQRMPTRGENAPVAHFEPTLASDVDVRDVRGALVEKEGATWLATPIVPDPHLMILGAGADAQPLAQLAKTLGWMVTLHDPRPANARPEHFPDVDHVIREQGDRLVDYAKETGVEAAVIMGHAKELDAASLSAMAQVPLTYLALLGPAHRRAEVFEEAALSPEELPVRLAGPAGLDIGSDFPEAIALAILAEAHAALKGRSAASLSGILPSS